MERDRVGEPAFGVGFTVPSKKLREGVFSVEMRAWRDAVELDDFSVADEGNQIRVWRTKYLAELIPKGVTHEAQARELARWADEALTALARQEQDPRHPAGRVSLVATCRASSFAGSAESAASRNG